MTRSEWYVYSPEGAIVIETANSAWEAAQKARTRPGFDAEDLRVEHKGTEPAPAMRSGKAAEHTGAWLREHKDWKRDEYA